MLSFRNVLKWRPDPLNILSKRLKRLYDKYGPLGYFENLWEDSISYKRLRVYNLHETNKTDMNSQIELDLTLDELYLSLGQHFKSVWGYIGSYMVYKGIEREVKARYDFNQFVARSKAKNDGTN